MPDQNVHIPYILLTFGPYSFSWKGGAPDYFTSLVHKKYQDQANTMEINLTYVPVTGQDDPNFLEQALIQAGGQCYVQYGDMGKTVPLYKGLVHSYKVTMGEGYLEYNLKLISSLVGFTYNDYPGRKIEKSKGETIKDVEDEIKFIVENYLQVEGNDFRSYDYDPKSVNFTDRVDFDTVTFPAGNPILAIKEAVSRLNVRKHWKSEEAYIDSFTNLGRVTLDGDGNPVQGPGKPVSQKLLNLLRTDHSKDYVLALRINDAGQGRGKIGVVLVNSDDQLLDTFNFKWGTRDGQVLDWSFDFDGAYSIFSVGDKFDSYIATDQNEQLGYTTVRSNIPKTVSNSMFTEISDKVESLTRNQREVDFHYAYKASLTVLGRTDEVDLGSTVIQVQPIIAGGFHHSAGKYVIIGVTDRVDSSGFTTTYDLYKSESSVSIYGSNGNKLEIYNNGSYVNQDEYNAAAKEYVYNPSPLNPNGVLAGSQVLQGLGGSAGINSGSAVPAIIGDSLEVKSATWLGKGYYGNRSNYGGKEGVVSKFSIHVMSEGGGPTFKFLQLTSDEYISKYYPDPKNGSGPSYHYIIGTDGKIVQLVKEINSANDPSGRDARGKAISILVAVNTDGSVNSAVRPKLNNLIADIGSRYYSNFNKGVLKFDSSSESNKPTNHFILHRWVDKTPAAAQCPTDWMISNMFGSSSWITSMGRNITTKYNSHPKRSEIIKYAQEMVGAHEGDSQHRKMVDTFNDFLNKNSWATKTASYMDYSIAWCDMFVGYCTIMVNNANPSLNIAQKLGICTWVPNHVSHFRNGGTDGSCSFHWSNYCLRIGAGSGSVYTPSPGDFIFFDDCGGRCSNPGDHIGIVYSCDGVTIKTIEGNTSDSCAFREYSVEDSWVMGFGQWKGWVG